MFVGEIKYAYDSEHLLQVDVFGTWQKYVTHSLYRMEIYTEFDIATWLRIVNLTDF